MKTSLLLLAIILCSFSVKGSSPDIVSVHGNDAFAMTHKAVEALGGMQRFVEPGQRVGILVNSGFREKGAFVDPDVVIAALKMIYEAGASEVVFLQHILPEYWERSSLEPEYRDMIAQARSIEANKFPSVFDEEHFVKIPSIEGAREEGELEVVREFFDVDVFINIPIAKHHSLTTLTNALKNLMGVNTRAANVTFHLNGPARNDPDYLAQRIADLNLLRSADLIISDVTYVIVTNGPSGPGEIVEPKRVVAGTDPVAIDAFCAGLTGFFVEDVLSIEKGYELGLGQKDPALLNVLEVTLEQ